MYIHIRIMYGQMASPSHDRNRGKHQLIVSCLHSSICLFSQPLIMPVFINLSSTGLTTPHHTCSHNPSSCLFSQPLTISVLTTPHHACSHNLSSYLLSQPLIIRVLTTSHHACFHQPLINQSLKPSSYLLSQPLIMPVLTTSHSVL